MKKTMRRMSTGLLVLLLLLGLLVFVLPAFGGIELLAVRGGSMSPAIGVGSVAVIQNVDPQDIRVGDIITYSHPDDGASVVTHRVVKVMVAGDDVRFHTKGDANEFPDAVIVSGEDIRGKFLFDIPYLGYLVHFVKMPLGFVMLVLVPGIIIVGSEIRKIVCRLREEKAREQIREKTVASDAG